MCRACNSADRSLLPTTCNLVLTTRTITVDLPREMSNWAPGGVSHTVTGLSADSPRRVARYPCHGSLQCIAQDLLDFAEEISNNDAAWLTSSTRI